MPAEHQTAAPNFRFDFSPQRLPPGLTAPLPSFRFSRWAKIWLCDPSGPLELITNFGDRSLYGNFQEQLFVD
jgi:hypothetical protein